MRLFTLSACNRYDPILFPFILVRLLTRDKSRTQLRNLAWWQSKANTAKHFEILKSKSENMDKEQQQASGADAAEDNQTGKKPQFGTRFFDRSPKRLSTQCLVRTITKYDGKIYEYIFVIFQHNAWYEL